MPFRRSCSNTHTQYRHVHRRTHTRTRTNWSQLMRLDRVDTAQGPYTPARPRHTAPRSLSSRPSPIQLKRPRHLLFPPLGRRQRGRAGTARNARRPTSCGRPLEPERAAVSLSVSAIGGSASLAMSFLSTAGWMLVLKLSIALMTNKYVCATVTRPTVSMS